MLRHLHVRHLALIEECALEFGPGLTALTGETGAGKSIVLDALALLTGQRAAPSVVRSGCEKAVVEALFDCPGNRRLAEWLAERGLDPDEPGEVILRREAHASGRSRAWINGRLTPLNQLAEVSALLLVLHGQHEQQSLLDPGVQRDWFDEFAGLGGQRAAVRRAHADLTAAQRERHDLRTEERGREQRLDFLRFQIEELEALGMRPGEVEELTAEEQRLGHAEELAEEGLSACTLLCEGTPEQPAALDLLGRVEGMLGAMAARDVRLRALEETFAEAAGTLDEVARELARYVESVEGDPERLAEVAERLDLLRRALRKHGPTETEALQCLETLRREAEQLERLETCCHEAEERLRTARAALTRAAAELAAARQRAKKNFLRPFLAMLKDFGMKDARVEVRLRPVTRGVELEDPERDEPAPPGQGTSPAARVGETAASRVGETAASRVARRQKGPRIPEGDGEGIGNGDGESNGTGNGDGSVGRRLCGPDGAEELEILLGANKGEALHPLRKVASGGELSRVMLALRSLSAQRGDVPLLVFDEIDAGISGVAVRRVAERIAALGERHQVLYVTHQPALAAVAGTHWVTTKEVVGGRTRTRLTRVEGARRQEEIARMLGDGSASRTSLALAAEILQIA